MQQPKSFIDVTEDKTETAIQTLPPRDPDEGYTGTEVTGDSSATMSSQTVTDDDAGTTQGAEVTGNPYANMSSPRSTTPGNRAMRQRKLPSRLRDYVMY